MPNLRRSPALAVAMLFALVLPGARAEEPGASKAFGPVAIEGDFKFDERPKKTRLAVSGVACAKAGVCLLVFDEGREARFATLGESGYVADPTPIRLADGPPKSEIDAEGAATYGKWFYVTGSHAFSRDRADADVKPEDIVTDGAFTCERRPLSRTFLRFPADPATGKIGEGAPEKGDLVRLFQASRVLAPALDKCLAEGQGLDIEGLAVSEKKLWIGFRGPTRNGRALLLSVPTEAAFGATVPEPIEPIELDLGQGRAIRDLQWVDDGLLILAGPDDVATNDNVGWEVARWTEAGGLQTRTPITLPAPERTGLNGCKDEEVKPEAIAVARSSADRWRVVVLSDGMCDGGPIWFDVRRP